MLVLRDSRVVFLTISANPLESFMKEFIFPTRGFNNLDKDLSSSYIKEPITFIISPRGMPFYGFLVAHKPFGTMGQLRDKLFLV